MKRIRKLVDINEATVKKMRVLAVKKESSVKELIEKAVEDTYNKKKTV